MNDSQSLKVKAIAIDFETTPVGFFNKRGKCGWSGHPRFAKVLIGSYSDFYREHVIEDFRHETLPQSNKRIFHNIAFDWSIGLDSGIFKLHEQNYDCLECTLIMSKLLKNNNIHSLKGLAQHELGHKSPTLFETVKYGTPAFIQYAKDDARYTAELYPILSKRIQKSSLEKLYREIELPFALIDAQCQRNGFRVNLQALDNSQKELQSIVRKIQIQLGDLTNWDSPKQVKQALYRDWKLPIVLKNGKPSTSKKTISRIKGLDSRVQTLIELKEAKGQIRQIQTLKRFVDPTTSCIHPYNNTLGAGTGRCTSTNPNLQNINKERLRSFFISKENSKLIVLDFSQIEPRVLGHFLYPSEFSKLFFKDSDFYTELANGIFKNVSSGVPTRSVAKQLILANFYGMHSKTLAENLGVPHKEAENFLSKFSEAFPEIKIFEETLLHMAQANGYIEGLLHRRRYLPDISSSEDWRRRAEERRVLNSVIQGSAATLFKFKVVELMKQLGNRLKLLMHIHDEIVLECPTNEAVELLQLSKTILEAPINWFSIPLKVEGGIGNNWAEAKK